jgi:hypothetical protein
MELAVLRRRRVPHLIVSRPRFQMSKYDWHSSDESKTERAEKQESRVRNLVLEDY